MKKRMRILTFLLAGAVAFGTAQAPLTAMAATSGTYSITQPGTVNAGKNVAYKISGVTKKQYAVVRVRGAAKTEVTVSKGSKNITSAVRSKSGYKMSGTGSTLSFKIKANKSAVNKKYKVNVKIYNSANKKLAKKVSATSKVLVAATSVSLDSTTLSLKTGESRTLSYTLKPATSTDSVTYTSTNKSVASVDANGKVTAEAEGSATITATTTSGKTAICTVNVAAAQTDVPNKPDVPDTPDTPDTPEIPEVKEAADIKAEVSNALADYENTVLSTTNAELSVKVTDEDGNAIANKNVILTLDTNLRNGLNIPGVQIQGEVENAPTSMTKTDDKGIATFVLRDKDSEYTAAASYTVKAVGTEVETKGVVKFATVSIKMVELAPYSKPTDPNYDKLDPGENARDAWNSTVGSRTQMSFSGTAGTYVASQKVSTAGTDDHAVTLKAVPTIVVPDAEIKADTQDTYIQTITAEDGTVGAYSVYEDQEKFITLEKDTEDVQGATLVFKSINLSKYTKLAVDFYESEKDAEDGKKIAEATQYVEGEKTVTNRSVQIPVTDQTVGVVGIRIMSAGQVDTDKALGYVVDSIRYTYTDPSTLSEGSKKEGEPLKGATITWEDDAVVYEHDQKLEDADLAKLGFWTGTNTNSLPNEYETGHKFTYIVPSYPSTGNAIITEKDVKGDIVAYYLAPTSNKVAKTDIKNEQKDTIGYEYNWKNVNILTALNDEYFNAVRNLQPGTSYATLKRNPGAESYAYKVSSEEIQALTGKYQVSDNGQTIVVNSEKSGAVNLKGTVSIAGVGEKELNGLNKNLYTSVQFNPIPSESVAVSDGTFLALVGQDVNVTAQLVDKNGNKVSTSGKDIQIYGKFNDTKAAVISPADNGKTSNQIWAKGSTDSNGQFKAVFSSNISASSTDGKANIEQLTACVMKNGAVDESYKVQLTIGDRNVNKADIFWLGANLQFKNTEVNEKADDPVIKTTNNNMVDVKTHADGSYVINPEVGSHWKYGVQTVGDYIYVNGTWYAITIEGLNVNMTSAPGNKGTYAATGVNGEVSATSLKSNIDTIVATLDSNSTEIMPMDTTSTGGQMKFLATQVDRKENPDSSITWEAVDKAKIFEAVNVGTGAANLAAELDLYVKWGETNEKVLQAITPSIVKGNKLDDNSGTRTIYVRVTDSVGENPVEDGVVKATASDTASLVDENGSTISGTYKLDEMIKGYVPIIVKAPTGSETSTTVTVTYDETQTQKFTINWTNQDALAVAEDETAHTPLVKTPNLTTIELTMNNIIDETYLTKGMFTVKEYKKVLVEAPEGEGTENQDPGVPETVAEPEEAAPEYRYELVNTHFIKAVDVEDGKKVIITLEANMTSGNYLVIEADEDTTTIPGMSLFLTDLYGYSMGKGDFLVGQDKDESGNPALTEGENGFEGFEITQK